MFEADKLSLSPMRRYMLSAVQIKGLVDTPKAIYPSLGLSSSVDVSCAFSLVERGSFSDLGLQSEMTSPMATISVFRTYVGMDAFLNPVIPGL